MGREEVPLRLRRLLNVESGLNDGLALPVVVILLAVASREEIEAVTIAEELVLGMVIGVIVPWVTLRLERTRLFDLAKSYEPLYAFAVGAGHAHPGLRNARQPYSRCLLGGHRYDHGEYVIRPLV